MVQSGVGITENDDGEEVIVGVGRYRYRDLNGDGIVNADDRTFLGNPNPDFTYGLNLGLNYREFDMSMFWYGAQEKDIFYVVKEFTDLYLNFAGGTIKHAINES